MRQRRPRVRALGAPRRDRRRLLRRHRPRRRPPRRHRGDRVRRRRHDAIPQEVFDAPPRLVQFRRAAAPLREVIGQLLRREIDWIGPEAIVLHPGRLRPLAAGRRPHRVAARPADRPARSPPRGRVEPDERRDEEDVVLRRDPARLDAHRRHLRHELQVHARAATGTSATSSRSRTMASPRSILWFQFKKRGWL